NGAGRAVPQMGRRLAPRYRRRRPDGRPVARGSRRVRPAFACRGAGDDRRVVGRARWGRGLKKALAELGPLLASAPCPPTDTKRDGHLAAAAPVYSFRPL